MLIAKWYKIKLLPRIGGGSHITERFLRFPESKFSIIICADDSGRRLLRSFQWSHLAEWAANKSRFHCHNCEGSLQWGPALSSLLIEPIWGSVPGRTEGVSMTKWGLIESWFSFKTILTALPHSRAEDKEICNLHFSEVIRLLPFILNVDLHRGLIWSKSLHHCT